MKSYPTYDDIEKCEDEPIAFYPKIQRHGCVLILDAALQIRQVSDNCNEIIGIDVQQLLEKNVKDIISASYQSAFENWSGDEHQYLTIELNGRQCGIVLQKIPEGFLLDIEVADTSWDGLLLQQKMLSSFKLFAATKNLQELLDEATVRIQELFSYDRVMIYQFDDDWSGHVVSESKENHLESWLGLHYPASDIPKNARDLFQSQGVRSLSNISETYAEIIPMVHPETGRLTDISKSSLRGSSPFHIEYLTNMGVKATLNCAIIQNNKLWGLIACHHYSPKTTTYVKRQSCHLLAEMFSSQISLKVSDQTFENMERMSLVRQKLIDTISKNWDIVQGLTGYEITGKDLIDCSDFVIGFNGEMSAVSNVLSNQEIEKLASELFDKFPGQECIALDCVSEHCTWMLERAKEVSGILLYRLSQQSTTDFLVWFRPEMLKEVNWGGDPSTHKKEKEQNLRLSPRKSFDKWVEQVQFTSKSWTKSEVSVVKSLITDIKSLIINRFTEVNSLNKKLSSLNEELESFSYSVSHDLRGPLRGIDGFAQILIEDYSDVLDDFGKESLQVIINSSAKMNELMDDILGYSGLGKVDKKEAYQNVKIICEAVIRDFDLKNEYPQTVLNIQDDIPDIYADKSMIYQLFANLITNAFKYSGKVEFPKVEIGFEMDKKTPIYFVKDNGIGFNQEYATKMFGVFTRLVKDEYKGTGVGLAIAQRVVQRHDGTIWAQGEIGKGAVFKFRFNREKAKN